MAVRDHINRVNKLRAQVITVDPSQRLIEVATADGGLRQLSVYDVPSQFTWPLEGEEWSIYEENGYWYLGNKWLDPDESELFEAMNPGDSLTPKHFTTKLEDPNSSVFLVKHGLKNECPTVSITESRKYFIFGKDASATDTSLYCYIGVPDFPTTGGVIWCEDTQELIKYTTWAYDIPTNMNLFTGCTRGYAGTTASAHKAINFPEPFEKCWKVLEPIFPDFVTIVDPDRILIQLPSKLGSLDSSHLKVTVTG
jgi:hypothetical protein